MVMTVVNQTSIQWMSPAPLWPELVGQRGQSQREPFRQPSILRFATDSFMDEFAAMLSNEPWRLGEWRAAPEAWWCPLPGGTPVEAKVLAKPPRARSLQRAYAMKLLQSINTGVSQSGNADDASEFLDDVPSQLKLYQPAHQRFYLVTACLVCRVPGLPDRVIDHGAAERAAFVVRRLRVHTPVRENDRYPDPTADNLDSFDEYAFVPTPQGPQWWLVPNPESLSEGEELLPLFGVTYTENDGRKRRLLSGLVPVSRREAYMAAVPSADSPSLREGSPLAPVDQRMAQWKVKVADPWRQVIDIRKMEMSRRQKMVKQKDIASADEKEKIDEDLNLQLAQINAQIQTSSWYILLDFADYLSKYVHNVWEVIVGRKDVGTLDSGRERPLYDAIATAQFYTNDETTVDTTSGVLTRPTIATRGTPGKTLKEALAAIVNEDCRMHLETAVDLYPSSTRGSQWPDFIFRLTTSKMELLLNGTLEGASTDTLDNKIKTALGETRTARTPPLPLAAQLSSIDGSEPGWFVIRCVFERPNCGPLNSVVVSQPTDPFQLAPFFDPEAPARPVRISLPVDTTPAGLRKFAKNTAFVMSNVLCGQVSKMQNLTFLDLILHVLPWPLHKDLPVGDMGPCEDPPGFDIGMICSLSIPIVTICALILLMIIVGLLDFVFRWMPYLIMCFPLPKFNAKQLNQGTSGG